MCHGSCETFATKFLSLKTCNNSRILEIGSLQIHGGLRRLIESYGPAEYIGVDIVPGKGVDLVLDHTQIRKYFKKGSFDVVICTEVLEHAKKWHHIVSDVKWFCRTSGHILVTSRSPGFAYHCSPDDYWRFTIKDFEYIFSDLNIISITPDPFAPGVFCFASKPDNFRTLRLDRYIVSTVRSTH